jgi:penicillin-binding protein 1A
MLTLVSLGLVGLAAGIIAVITAISYYAQDLPDYRKLKDYRPPVVTRIHAGDGRLLAEFAQERRIFIPEHEIPERVKNAFISAEDKNFYRHPGVDFLAVLRAAYTNLKNIGTGQRPEGASTITQQVAKNFLLSDKVTITRKIREAVLAFRMERAMSKDRLLELYLNEIYLGNGSYGVAAAALNYFNKSLDELEVAEAAYLAALPKAPNNYKPVENHDAALARRNWVIDRMAEDGHITKARAKTAKEKPLKTKKRERALVRAPYFAASTRKQLKKRFGEEGLSKGGLAVHTSLNPDYQDIAENALRDGLLAYSKRHGWHGPLDNWPNPASWKRQLQDYPRPEGALPDWQLAYVMDVSADKARIGVKSGLEGKIPLDALKWARKALDKGYTGERIRDARSVLDKGDIVLVDKQKTLDDGKDIYSLEQIPDIEGAIIAMDPHTGRVLAMKGGWRFDESQFNRATQADRQPGSAFKPFVYLTALNNGFTPATLILDAPFVIEDKPGSLWKPENYSQEFYGPTPLRQGVENSKNLMTVRLADYVGMDKIAKTAEIFGVAENMKPHLANALGAAETTLLDLTTGYAMIANGGKRIKATFIDRIQDRFGKTIFRHDERKCPSCGDLIRWQNQTVPRIKDKRKQITDPRSAYQMISILEGVVKRGTGQRLASLDRPVAGKTGTTNEVRDAWFIGFTPNLVVGAYVGFDEPKTLGANEQGASVAAPIVKSVLRKSLEGTPPTPFQVPKGVRMVRINLHTGQRATAQDSSEDVIWEAFKKGNEPNDKVYVLESGGISAMPNVPGNLGTREDAASTGTGGIY